MGTPRNGVQRTRRTHFDQEVASGTRHEIIRNHRVRSQIIGQDGFTPIHQFGLLNSHLGRCRGETVAIHTPQEVHNHSLVFHDSSNPTWEAASPKRPTSATASGRTTRRPLSRRWENVIGCQTKSRRCLIVSTLSAKIYCTQQQQEWRQAALTVLRRYSEEFVQKGRRQAPI